MKTFVLDANNIIHKDSELKRTFDTTPAGATAALLHLIEQYNSKYPSYKFSIFFDSHQELFPKYSTVSLKWSTNGEDADTLIKKHLETTSKVSSLIVVSSDGEVISNAKRYNCSVLTSEEFLAILKPKAAKNNIPSQSQSLHSTSEKPNRITKKEMLEFKEIFTSKKP
ncbi:MAG: NYN domain-containing protein [Candidatus Kapabacteria bacterium]|nr:NYN domain-containing protein [Candidatus Kapabacteria bacterium]